jgi:serine/threonine protein kinase
MADKTSRSKSIPTNKRKKIETNRQIESESNDVTPVFFRNDDPPVEGRYKILKVISGKGAEAWVYLCEDENEKKRVALKLYHPQKLPKEEVIKKLIEISRGHKDIINVYDYKYIREQFYEVMEYAEGGNLASRLHKQPFSEEELEDDVIPEVLNGLKSCHEEKIYHRDIKPSNIFYRDKEQRDIVLGDFGISSLREKSSIKPTGLGGTDAFIAPESFGYYDQKKDRFESCVSKEGDYYSLGITLIYLLGYGDQTFPKGLTGVGIQHRKVSESREKLIPDQISDKFKQLLRGLLTKEREGRWGASEIEGWLNGEKDIPVCGDVLPEYAPHGNIPTFTDKEMATNDVRELAVLFQTHEAREKIKTRLSQGIQPVSTWLMNVDQDKADKVRMVEETVKDSDLALLEISCILDNNVPYYLTPELKANTPAELALLIDKNQKNWELGKEQLKSKRISVWLKYTSGGQEILDKWNKIENV